MNFPKHLLRCLLLIVPALTLAFSIPPWGIMAYKIRGTVLSTQKVTAEIAPLTNDLWKAEIQIAPSTPPTRIHIWTLEPFAPETTFSNKTGKLVLYYIDTPSTNTPNEPVIPFHVAQLSLTTNQTYDFYCQQNIDLTQIPGEINSFDLLGCNPVPK